MSHTQTIYQQAKALLDDNIEAIIAEFAQWRAEKGLPEPTDEVGLVRESANIQFELNKRIGTQGRAATTAELLSLWQTCVGGHWILTEPKYDSFRDWAIHEHETYSQPNYFNRFLLIIERVFEFVHQVDIETPDGLITPDMLVERLGIAVLRQISSFFAAEPREAERINHLLKQLGLSPEPTADDDEGDATETDDDNPNQKVTLYYYRKSGPDGPTYSFPDMSDDQEALLLMLIAAHAEELRTT